MDFLRDAEQLREINFRDNPDVALGVLRQMADRLALAIETVESLRRERTR
ncbi:MAG: hypothetical protein VW546_10050 [Gammaproteobacteria bacterium]